MPKRLGRAKKMVLLPFPDHEELDRERIVKDFGTPNSKRRFGVVALVPSFNRTKDWKAYGATVADKESVSDVIDALKRGEFEKAVVLRESL